jgi:hypothetical protein
VERIVEHALDLARDRPRRADLDVVDLAQGRELAGGAGEEDLVSQRDLGARDVALHHVVAEVPRDLHAGPSIDPVEDPRGLRRRVDGPAPDDEDVLARALADVTLVVEQERLLVAGLQRLDLRQHGVEVLPRRLRMGDQRVGRDAPV